MFWPILILIQLCAAALLEGRMAAPTGTIRTVYQFPNDTWVENIAVRSNGQLLVTIVTTPEVYLIDPSKPGQAPKLVASFPDSLGVFGIVEIEDDVFAVIRQNFTVDPFTDTVDSSIVSQIDLRDSDNPKVTDIATLPQALVLNGITTAAPGSKYVLITDSVVGVIWRLNTHTLDIDVVLNTTATQPKGSLSAGGIGANGLHSQDGQLYFTNFNKGFYRVPIHSDGTTAGDVVELAAFIDGDDFALDSSGTAYVARGFVDKIEVVKPSGAHAALKFTNKNALVLVEGATAASFGRTESDKDTLYVTTNGGLAGLVSGTSIQGGRVLAIDMK